MEQAALQSALPASGEIGDSWRADDDGATSKAEVEHFDPTHCAQLARTGQRRGNVGDGEDLGLSERGVCDDGAHQAVNLLVVAACLPRITLRRGPS